MEWGKVPPGVQKVKKKQVKDELDRIKQAEKKKRRLEKALATSAAIRSELEKKKQKKKEEQQRLDEEGAAIAEAVALHVLLGEDSDNSCNLMLKKDEEFSQWESGGRFDLFMGGLEAVVPRQNISKCSLEEIGMPSDAYRFEQMWNGWGNTDWMLSSAPLGSKLQRQYFEHGGLDTAGVAAGLSAGQAISSLEIGEDTPLDTYAFNQMILW